MPRRIAQRRRRRRARRPTRQRFEHLDVDAARARHARCRSAARGARRGSPTGTTGRSARAASGKRAACGNRAEPASRVERALRKEHERLAVLGDGASRVAHRMPPAGDCARSTNSEPIRRSSQPDERQARGLALDHEAEARRQQRLQERRRRGSSRGWRRGRTSPPAVRPSPVDVARREPQRRRPGARRTRSTTRRRRVTSRDQRRSDRQARANSSAKTGSCTTPARPEADPPAR